MRSECSAAIEAAVSIDRPYEEAKVAIGILNPQKVRRARPRYSASGNNNKTRQGCNKELLDLWMPMRKSTLRLTRDFTAPVALAPPRREASPD